MNCAVNERMTGLLNKVQAGEAAEAEKLAGHHGMLPAEAASYFIIRLTTTPIPKRRRVWLFVSCQPPSPC